jgi:Flp pilus assembly protein TadG
MKRASKLLHLFRLRDQKGVTIILVAIMMFVFLGIAALAIDLSSLYIVRNELQNAADAGSLAGARFLYNDYGTAVNEGANQIAYTAATANKALAMEGAVAVDVNWQAEQNSGANVDVQRGHWSFATRTFTANDSLDAVDLWGVTTAELDTNIDFINAVRVVARRQATPAASFFARIFGHADFELSAEAVAYIGFAGSVEPFGVDMPIAICAEALGDPYNCSVGRFINSGGNLSTSESGGWTDFESCGGAASRTTIQTAVNTGCAGGGANQNTILFGSGLRMNNGQVQAEFNNLLTCWENATSRQQSWPLMLPVIDCTEGGENISITTCNRVVGAVLVRVLWITEAGVGQVQAPYRMEGWGEDSGFVDSWEAAENATQEQRWTDFVAHFNLRNLNGQPAPLDNKTIYFAPDCNPHVPTGNTGGENFGILAEIPVLVK